MRSAPAPSHATAVWALLVGATLTAWWLADGHGLPARLATTAALLIAAFKVRLVLLHFMELRHAPLRWRAVFEAWLVICSGVILAGYWHGPV
ncbi:MAG TPA: cytochrome C oxidase subunit IV family protein [Methylibium sp.]|nr:cytochrome C oxidase subunit IV family protein [Methylibium sp.]